MMQKWKKRGGETNELLEPNMHAEDYMKITQNMQKSEIEDELLDDFNHGKKKKLTK